MNYVNKYGYEKSVEEPLELPRNTCPYTEKCDRVNDYYNKAILFVVFFNILLKYNYNIYVLKLRKVFMLLI